MTDDLKHVPDQLAIIIRLLAIIASAQEPTLRGKCAVLARAGLKPSGIAETLATTANTVRVELSRQRKMTRKEQK